MILAGSANTALRLAISRVEMWMSAAILFGADQLTAILVRGTMPVARCGHLFLVPRHVVLPRSTVVGSGERIVAADEARLGTRLSSKLDICRALKKPRPASTALHEDHCSFCSKDVGET